jgi:hypothetical protein
MKMNATTNTRFSFLFWVCGALIVNISCSRGRKQKDQSFQKSFSSYPTSDSLLLPTKFWKADVHPKPGFFFI